jgi:hypothetical protein
VPDTVVQAAERLAAELGTTRNEALVQLAAAGAAAADRRREVEAVAAERRAAVGRGGFAAAPFLDPATLRAAMLAGRTAP